MKSINDFNILSAIIDEKDDTKGIALYNGTSIKEIMYKTDLSLSKVRKTIFELSREGLVTNGLKQGTAKTYIVTNDGIKKLLKFKGVEL